MDGEIMRNSDEWETPDSLFDALNDKYNFIIDACANKSNAKCPIFFNDCLKIDWFATLQKQTKRAALKVRVQAVFMNPPYSNPAPFLHKAWEESVKFKVVCLVSNSIITCKYLDFLDVGKGKCHVREWDPHVRFQFLSRRTRFNHPSKVSSNPPGGCMVIVMDRRNIKDE
jgi:phage N-6-adenine-methyltransferase